MEMCKLNTGGHYAYAFGTATYALQQSRYLTYQVQRKNQVMKSTLTLAHVQIEPVLKLKLQGLERPCNKKSHLSINDLPSGVEDGGVVHNLNVAWLQLLGDVELWTLSQLGHRPVKSNHKCYEMSSMGFSCQALHMRGQQQVLYRQQKRRQN